jgi:hypothetical protein
MTANLVIVRLADPSAPGDGGVVVKARATLVDFEAMVLLRDGARDTALRLWRGDFEVGSLVRLS